MLGSLLGGTRHGRNGHAGALALGGGALGSVREASASAERSAELRPEPEDLTLSAICDAAVRLASPPSKIEELNTDIMCGVVVEGGLEKPECCCERGMERRVSDTPEKIYFCHETRFWRIAKEYAASARISDAKRPKSETRRGWIHDEESQQTRMSPIRADPAKTAGSSPRRTPGGRETDVTSAFSNPPAKKTAKRWTPARRH